MKFTGREGELYSITNFNFFCMEFVYFILFYFIREMPDANIQESFGDSESA